MYIGTEVFLLTHHRSITFMAYIGVCIRAVARFTMNCELGYIIISDTSRTPYVD